MKPLRSHTASSRLQILSKPSHLPLFHPHDDIPSGQPDPTRNIDQNTSEVPLTGWGLRIIVCFVLQMTHSNSGKAKCFSEFCVSLMRVRANAMPSSPKNDAKPCRTWLHQPMQPSRHASKLWSPNSGWLQLFSWQRSLQTWTVGFEGRYSRQDDLGTFHVLEASGHWRDIYYGTIGVSLSSWQRVQTG